MIGAGAVDTAWHTLAAWILDTGFRDDLVRTHHPTTTQLSPVTDAMTANCRTVFLGYASDITAENTDSLEALTSIGLERPDATATSDRASVTNRSITTATADVNGDGDLIIAATSSADIHFRSTDTTSRDLTARMARTTSYTPDARRSLAGRRVAGHLRTRTGHRCVRTARPHRSPTTPLSTETRTSPGPRHSVGGPSDEQARKAPVMGRDRRAGVWHRHGKTYVARRDPLTTGGKVPVGRIPVGAQPASGVHRPTGPEPADNARDLVDPAPRGATDGNPRVQITDASADAASHSRALADLTGPFYNFHDLQRWLGTEAATIRGRIDHRALLALKAADGSLLFPAWQFTTDRATIPYLAEVLRILAGGIDDPWTWAIWLCAPDDDLAGLTSAQWLAAGNDPEPVLLEAARDATHWRT